MKQTNEHHPTHGQLNLQAGLSGLTVECVNDPAMLLAEKETWDDWCEKADHPSVFCTAGWLATWWDMYRTAAEPWILRIAESDGKTVGYAPLMRIIRKPLPGLSLRSIEFIGTGERVCPEYLDVIAAPGKIDAVRHAVCDFLAANRQEWDRLWLTDGLAQNSLTHLAATWSWPGHAAELMAASMCPYLNLDRTWEDFLAGRTSHMRRKIRQIGHRIERKFTVDWRVFQAGDDPGEAIAVMTDLHTRARGLKGETGNFIDEQYRRFHCAMIIHAAFSERLYLAFLQLDRQPAAFYYGFLFGKCLFNYQTGFNPAFGRYRPGWYALRRMVEDLIDRGCTRVDFLRGDHDYKWHWSDDWHETVNSAVFSPGLAGRLGGLASGLAAKVRARRNPAATPPDFILRRKRHGGTDER